MLEVLGPGGLPDFGPLDFVLRKLQAIQGVRFFNDLSAFFTF